MKNPASSAIMSGLAQNLRANSANWFSTSAGAVLALYGTACLLDAFGKSRLMDVIHDPLFGISFRHLLLLAGIVGLTVAFLCLFTNKRTLNLTLIGWLAANFITYRIGLWTMGWCHPYGWLAGMMGGLGISPIMADGILTLIIIYLITGGIAIIWIERRKAHAAEFLKISCPACGGHIAFAIQNLGQQIPCPHCQAVIALRKPESLKMSCYFCKEHIEFPAHALGQKIPCPHCNRSITLMERA